MQERPLRLLLAVANPTGLPDGCSPLDVAGEIASLAGVLAEQSGRVRGTLLAGRTGLPDDLRGRLTGQGWILRDGVTSWQAIQRWLPGHHVLHILAHGQFKVGDSPGKDAAYLLLEHEGAGRGARGAVDRMSDNHFVAGLAGVHPLPQLVFLAACDSARRPPGAAATGVNPFVGLAPKLVAGGVPAIVAMQDEAPIDLARTVAADFYRRLFDHGLVDRALNEARSLVYERDQFAWAIPVLFLRLRDGRLFAEPEKAPARRLQAPRPPDTFAGRGDEIRRLGDRLKGRPDAAVTVAIQGVGGQGKSALARRLGRLLLPDFPGGVLWVDVGENADSPSRRADIVNRIALELGLDLKDEPLPEKREAIVRSELDREGRLLAILDDVWEADLGRWLRENVLPDGCAVLVTSRDLGVCHALASYVEPLSGLPAPDGLRLLANLLGELGPHEAKARELVTLLDGHALALELAARQTLNGPRGLAKIKAQLEKAPSLDVLTLEGEERRDTSVARCLLLSYKRLDPDQQRRYRCLGVFAQAPFDLPALAAVWGDASSGAVQSKARTRCTEAPNPGHIQTVVHAFHGWNSPSPSWRGASSASQDAIGQSLTQVQAFFAELIGQSPA